MEKATAGLRKDIVKEGERKFKDSGSVQNAIRRVTSMDANGRIHKQLGHL